MKIYIEYVISVIAILVAFTTFDFIFKKRFQIRENFVDALFIAIVFIAAVKGVLKGFVAIVIFYFISIAISSRINVFFDKQDDGRL